MQPLADVLAKPGFHKAAVNFGWLLAERAGRSVLGALVGLLVARYLGPEKLGSLAYCVALVTLLGFAPGLGLDAVVKREVLHAPDKTTEVLASSLVLRLMAGLFAYAAVWIAARSGRGFAGDEARLFTIIGLVMFQPALFLSDLWLQAQLRAKWATGVRLGALGVASALRLWLILAHASLAAFAWVIVAEMILSGIGFFSVARRSGLRFPISAARIATMKRLAGEAWPLMFTAFAIVVYLRIDEIMLRQMAGPAAVGVYAAAVKLSESWSFLPTALAASVLPALLRARQEAAAYQGRLQEYYDLSAAAAYGLSIVIAPAAPWIVRLAYGDAFAAAGPILAVHIWSSIFVFLGVARGQWLVNEGLQRFYLVATLGGAVLNILLNYLLIPRWGGLGAAVATVISYGLAAWLTSYFHPAVRATAAMQTRALLLPFTGWRYLRRP